jgi:hypothetical protein
MIEEHKNSIGYSQAAKKEERIFNAEMTKSLRTMTETIEPIKQTAVSWLVEQIDNPHTLYWLREAIDQALEMERQQIIDAYHINPLESKWKNIGSDYYNQTFTEPKND